MNYSANMGGIRMKCDMLIKGGWVVDPATGRSGVSDVLISAGKIVAQPGPDECLDALQVINAAGLLVFPGLIDFHTHLFYRGSQFGVPAEVGLIPMGVTTAVDAGSAGVANYEIFYANVVANSLVRIKSFLNASPVGLITTKYHEKADPQRFEEDRIQQVFAKYPDNLLGLKILVDKGTAGEFGIESMKAALRIAETIGCPLAAHTTNPTVEVDELAELFRPGDIFAHMYHGVGSTIIGKDQRVLPAVKAARKRGVLFDAANGRAHFSFKTAQAALADDFPPDIISSDVSSVTFCQSPVYGLPYIMSKYLNLGVSLAKVIKACTVTPAECLGMAGEIGNLGVGAWADVAIFKLIDSPVEYRDAEGQIFVGNQLLVPQATIREGRLVYRQIGFFG